MRSSTKSGYSLLNNVLKQLDKLYESGLLQVTNSVVLNNKQPGWTTNGSAQNPMSAWSWSITDCRGWARKEHRMYRENCILSTFNSLCRNDLDWVRTSSPCAPLMPSLHPWGQPRDWYILPTSATDRPSYSSLVIVTSSSTTTTN